MRGENGFEVLLTEEALNRCYDHIVALEKELSSLGSLLAGMNAPRASASNDPNRSQLEEAVRVHQAQFRENRRRRRSLKRLPKFPTESKLNAAVIRSREAQAAILAGWFQPLSEPPQRPTQMSPLLHEATGLPPLDQDKKD